ncbi:MAG: hypothetical protein U0228_37115 [Myxococcaceae bacterium]
MASRSNVLVAALAIAFAVVLGSCTPPGTKLPTPVDGSNHSYFPIGAGSKHALGSMTREGALGCDSCHRPSAPTLADVHCDSCHKHSVSPINPRLHLGVPEFIALDTSSATTPEEAAELRGKACVGCHPTGEPRAFSHTGISNQCAMCHASTNPFDAFPMNHRTIGPNTDCGGCHKTEAWLPATTVATAFDPNRSVLVNALAPTWSGPVITAVTPDPQMINMEMNHGASAVDAAVLSNCGGCHAQADQGEYYPGLFHLSLINQGIAQPTQCDECHGAAGPRSFVGMLDAARTPQSGPMRHDAVTWAGGAPSGQAIVTQPCATCHQPPSDLVDATWQFANGRDDGGAVFHRSLTEASAAQPTSCIDCHANTRPAGNVTSASITFDHGQQLGDCASCHKSFTQWSGGLFHSATGPTPTTCLPCHEGERPSSTTGWAGNFSTSPFDYVGNANGVGHGADQDCVVCHTGPGTGAWGTNQNWQQGTFGHAAQSIASTTCISCHTTQRPDLLAPPRDAGFDHALNGTGDCVGCHQASMTRMSFVNLLPIPGGDWRGGQSYPGDVLISTPGQAVRIPSTLLTRAGPLVTSMTTTNVTLQNFFLHTSSQINAAISPGPAATPDQNSCWHCHTSTGTTVTALAGGKFHSSLMNFRTMPAAAITPLPEPTLCNDCHGTMRPPNIVSRTDGGVAWVGPMDHAATFTGGSVTGVPAMDCGSCHRTPGLGAVQWSDGKFHQNIPSGATPTECVNCHYPFMTLSQADVTFPDAGTPSTFTMKHRSTKVTTHACASCHATALSKATQGTTAAQWKTGSYHPQMGATQPSTCVDCHTASKPTQATQGTVLYALAQGGTSTNGNQWMNHAAAQVTALDCASCHLADAKASGSAWSKTAPLHAKIAAASLTTCANCHGLTNGRGTVVGTNNNMPTGLNDTATTTTSSASPGVKDQIAHTDSNVTRFECKFCHTQVGPSTTAGIQGKEWAQASFHKNFTTANPLVMDGSTGRCSNCHMNVKPGAAFTAFNHAAFTATAGTQDCSSCHSWPGDNPAMPNWKGAAGIPHAASGSSVSSTLDCSTCHGFNGSSMKRLMVANASHYGGITNGNKCTSCHINFAGFKDTTTNLLYGHTNASVPACSTCHVFTGSLYTTLTNTPSLTHPSTNVHQFSQTLNVTGSFNGDSFNSPHTNAKMTRCESCHQYATTTATTNIWPFKHRPTNPGVTNSKSSIGCNQCH